MDWKLCNPLWWEKGITNLRIFKKTIYAFFMLPFPPESSLSTVKHKKKHQFILVHSMNHGSNDFMFLFSPHPFSQTPTLFKLENLIPLGKWLFAIFSVDAKKMKNNHQHLFNNNQNIEWNAHFLCYVIWRSDNSSTSIHTYVVTWIE